MNVFAIAWSLRKAGKSAADKVATTSAAFPNASYDGTCCPTFWYLIGVSKKKHPFEWTFASSLTVFHLKRINQLKIGMTALSPNFLVKLLRSIIDFFSCHYSFYRSTLSRKRAQGLKVALCFFSFGFFYVIPSILNEAYHVCSNHFSHRWLSMTCHVAVQISAADALCRFKTPRSRFLSHRTQS